MAGGEIEEEGDFFPLSDIDVDSLQEPSSCSYYCDPCKTMFTTSGLKDAQSAKGYRHSSSLRELGERAKPGSYFPRCALCEAIIDDMDRNSWSIDNMSVVFFLALKNKEHRLDDPYSNLMPFDRLVGYLFDNESGSYFGKSLVKLVAIADDADPASAVIPRRPVITDLTSNVVVSKAKAWIRNCQSSHPNCPRAKIQRLPSRVVDVGTESKSPSVRVHTVAAQQCGEYICLSYCWGGPQAITATQNTLQELQNGIPVENLGQTIQDAIEVTRQLGFRYLWVDALCIIQDDDKDKEREIHNMASIYKNATITIAASTSTNSYEGFLRRKRTPPLGPKCHLPIELPDGKVGKVSLVSSRHHYPNHPLDSRAWAYQEFLLSTRVLVYSDVELLWECESQRQVPVRESFVSYEDNSPRRRLQELRRRVRRNEDRMYWNWHLIVNYYARRAMTDPEDRLNAIAGVAEVVGQLLNDEYMFGIWKSSAVDFLGWSTWSPTRRSPRAPSWSWASVDSPVGFSDYKPLAKVLACPPRPGDARGLVLMGKVRSKLPRGLSGSFRLDAEVEECERKRRRYLLLGDLGHNTGATALILMQVGQNRYRRIGCIDRIAIDLWHDCAEREITLE